MCEIDINVTYCNIKEFFFTGVSKKDKQTKYTENSGDDISLFHKIMQNFRIP